MESIKIHGKDYVLVNSRIKKFRTDKKYNGFAATSDDEYDVVRKLVAPFTKKK